MIRSRLDLSSLLKPVPETLGAAGTDAAPKETQLRTLGYGQRARRKQRAALGCRALTLKLLISPPVAARHLEYQHVWLKQHSIVQRFTWKPST